METLAYIYTTIAYEDSNSAPDLRSFGNLNPKLSKSLLAGTVAISVATAAAICSNDAQALLQYGDVGPGVAVLQQDLNVTADQVYGYETERAVRRFQRRNGLQRDGIAGPQTLSALGLPADLSPRGGSVPISGSIVNVYALNVRSYPSLYAPVRNVLYYGQTVSLTGASRYRDGYNWVQINRGGWVADYYLSSGYGGGYGYYNGYGDGNGGYNNGYYNNGYYRNSNYYSNGSNNASYNNSSYNYGNSYYGNGYYGNGYKTVAGTAYVSAWNGLNIRNAPAGYVIGSLAYRQSVSLTGDRQYVDGRNWLKLSNGGWIAEDYLSYS